MSPSNQRYIMNGTIFVTSATGTVGSEVVKQLAAHGHSVIAAAHLNGNPAKKQKIHLPNVEVTEVDYQRPATLGAAMAKAEKLMLISPYTSDQVQLARNIVEEAKKNGIRQIVVLSGFNVEDEPKIDIGRKLYEQEQIVVASGIPYTFLRACSFMQNFINYYGPQPDGNIYLPVGGSRMNFVDARDIARVAVKALTEPGHENQIYRLATVVHTVAEAAQVLAEATGKTIHYVDVPAEALQSGMAQAGVPEWMIGENLELFAAAKAGAYEKTAPDFETVTGTKPISFQQFARDHQAAYAPVTPPVTH